MTTNPCVYCHQGGDPETGYRRTCPGCGRSYLARFPRDEQQQRESGERPAEMSNQQHIEQSQDQAVSGERPAAVSDVRQTAVQGSLF